jgi:putative N6-adenine-specific DNA methylase
MLCADRRVERETREEFLAKVDFTRVIRIFGSDSDPKAIAGAKSNLARAYALARGGRGRSAPQTETAERPASMPIFETAGMSGLKAPFDEAGFIITNPPYGLRLGEPEAVYRDMAALYRNFPGWKMSCITNHEGFESLFGRKAASCKEMTNGAIRSYFYQYNF